MSRIYVILGLRVVPSTAFFLISVIEHLPPADQGIALRELARCLKPGGILTITFDYGNYWGELDASGTIKNPKHLVKLIEQTGLEILYNQPLETDVELYPNFYYESIEYIFGVVFLRKPGEEERFEDSPLRFFSSLFSGRLFDSFISGTVQVKL